MEDIQAKTAEEPAVEAKETNTASETSVDEAKQPAEQVQKANDETAELKSQIEALKHSIKAQQEQLSTFDSNKAELENKTALVVEYEELLTNVIEAKLSEVPEEYKELVPSGTLKEKFTWLSKAEQTGLFKKQEQADVEIGKPLQVDVAKVDTTRLSASQLMQMAYSTLKK